MKIHACIFILLAAVETWQIDPGNVEYYSATSRLKTKIFLLVAHTADGFSTKTTVARTRLDVTLYILKPNIFSRVQLKCDGTQ
jgi:hypothetical protein